MKLLFKENIFEKNTPSCHASTLAKTDDGFVAAWFGGTEEGKDDVRIYVSVRINNKWEKPLCVSLDDGLPHWNPVLFNNGNELLLFYKSGKTIASWMTFITKSKDYGRTWTLPERLCNDDIGGRGPVKNKPIYLSNGWLVAPASTEIGQWKCFVDISKDRGKTWTKGNIVPSPDEKTNLIQPSIWEDSSGLHMLMRSNRQRIFRSNSKDNGLTWCKAYPINIPNNNSGLDLVKIKSDMLVLACNPVEAGRSPLSLLASYDKGLTFKHELTLEDGEGEFSYPSVIAEGNRVYGVYTYKRTLIRFFCVESQALPKI
ncbi:MAG TPA: exo-alpha-sialidase [Clostridiaceae bacterium]|nr:exo-alpha-sialidase [Clostridiaceae bacterium]HOA30739.1 exo-alpha-sialidase [Clostridia bacterium]